jgi:hypothetical protein
VFCGIIVIIIIIIIIILVVVVVVVVVVVGLFTRRDSQFVRYTHIELHNDLAFVPKLEFIF